MIDERNFMSFLKRLKDAGAEYFTFDDLEKFMGQQLKIGEWIPCSERLPEEKENPVTRDFYEYQVTFKSNDVTDIRHYKFGRGHWWNGGGIMDRYVIAWQPLPEPYIGEQHEG